MLFAAGVAIPPGTRNLGDYIDENDPCTMNPSDPICRTTQGDTTRDPCIVNPNDPICQQAIINTTQNIPTPGSGNTSWSNFVDSSAAGGTTPGFVTALAKGIDKLAAFFTPNVSASPQTTPSAAASLSRIPWKPVLLVLGLAGAGFAAYKWKKSKRTQV